MREEFRADGETWRVTVDEDDTARGVRTVVFHCMSNSNRPYRVVESSGLEGRDVERLSQDELGELFDRSQTMDYSRDPAAEPERHGV